MELPSSTRRVLTEVLAVLAGRAEGVSFTELRSALATPTEDLRLALEAGLRLCEIRRTGSHNTLRYLSNASG
jgi:hypothetical protein